MRAPWSSSGMTCSPVMAGCSEPSTPCWRLGVGRCQVSVLLVSNLALNF